MQPSEMRNLSDTELDVRTRELEEELFMLQLRRATSQLENPMKLRAVRRDLARCRTIHRERAKAS
ncbi:MAG TPA: 50S ribosomal protein L29 [Candidatus Binatia bacterium]